MRVTLLTNMLPPYRVGFYNALADRCDLTVVLDTVSEFDRAWSVDPGACRYRVHVMNSRSVVFTRRHPETGYEELRQRHLSERALLFLRRSRPEVVVSGELGLRSLFGLTYARTHRIPFVLASEGTRQTEGWVGRRKRWLRRLLSTAADRCWSNGPASSLLLRDYGARPERIDEGMTGIETLRLRRAVDDAARDRDSLRASLGLRDTTFVFTGSLSARKGVAQMLDAFSTLSAERRDFSLIVVGDGQYADAVGGWASDHADIPVHAPGFLQPPAIVPLLAAADWGILPTLDDNWSLATLEMSVAALPQLFSAYNGASVDLCREGVTGYMFDPLSPDGFVSALRRALDSGLTTVPASIVDELVGYYGPEAQADRALESLETAVATRRRAR